MRTQGPWVATRLDAEPEHGEDGSAYDTKVAEPEAKGGAVEDGERHVQARTNRNEQHERRRTAIMKCPTAMAASACLLHAQPYERKARDAHGEHATHQVKPIASIELANCHIAACVASDIQYAM
ncbi:hypothetical protein H0H87_012954 [Tephrocybe sp. NHM501043]|nr:hypothetical protein H0H87_012954 [Tephrocybe sp. NHM501043]